MRIKVVGEEAEISYSICAEKRGMGLGKEMLALLAQKVFFEIGYEQKYLAYEISVDKAVNINNIN